MVPRPSGIAYNPWPIVIHTFSEIWPPKIVQGISMSVTSPSYSTLHSSIYISKGGVCLLTLASHWECTFNCLFVFGKPHIKTQIKIKQNLQQRDFNLNPPVALTHIQTRKAALNTFVLGHLTLKLWKQETLIWSVGSFLAQGFSDPFQNFTRCMQSKQREALVK